MHVFSSMLDGHVWQHFLVHMTVMNEVLLHIKKKTGSWHAHSLETKWNKRKLLFLASMCRRMYIHLCSFVYLSVLIHTSTPEWSWSKKTFWGEFVGNQPARFAGDSIGIRLQRCICLSSVPWKMTLRRTCSTAWSARSMSVSIPHMRVSCLHIKKIVVHVCCIRFCERNFNG